MGEVGPGGAGVAGVLHEARFPAGEFGAQFAQEQDGGQGGRWAFLFFGGRLGRAGPGGADGVVYGGQSRGGGGEGSGLDGRGRVHGGCAVLLAHEVTL
ncbi:hypothetical protein GCM10025734_16150 [Kitasatospora paranensis]